MIDICTFTGVDERTDMSRLEAMAERHRFLEFGFLFSRTPEDKDQRYPSYDHLAKTLSGLGGVKTALHICGRAVNEFVAGDGEVHALAGLCGRVQLNFNIQRAPFGVDELAHAITAFGRPVITQHNHVNVGLAGGVDAANHHVLYDASGGRGVQAEGMSPPFARKRTGYAGGFGPDTIEGDVARVLAVIGDANVWIDMESKVRTDGYLDLDKCEAVAAKVAALIA